MRLYFVYNTVDPIIVFGCFAFSEGQAIEYVTKLRGFPGEWKIGKEMDFYPGFVFVVTE